MQRGWTLLDFVVATSPPPPRLDWTQASSGPLSLHTLCIAAQHTRSALLVVLIAGDLELFSHLDIILQDTSGRQ